MFKPSSIDVIIEIAENPKSLKSLIGGECAMVLSFFSHLKVICFFKGDFRLWDIQAIIKMFRSDFCELADDWYFMGDSFRQLTIVSHTNNLFKQCFVESVSDKYLEISNILTIFIFTFFLNFHVNTF